MGEEKDEAQRDDRTVKGDHSDDELWAVITFADRLLKEREASRGEVKSMATMPNPPALAIQFCPPLRDQFQCLDRCPPQCCRTGSECSPRRQWSWVDQLSYQKN
jgi:hypothetical protein